MDHSPSEVIRETAKEVAESSAAPSAGRREAMRSLCAMAMATLAVLGLRPAAAADTRNHKHQVHDQGKKGKTSGGGRQGPVGPTGPQGPPGPTGPAGGGGGRVPTITITRREGPVLSVAANSSSAVTVTCNAGETAIGGGVQRVFASRTNCHLLSSFGTFDNTNSWYIEAGCDANGLGVFGTEVVCLAIT
jgi:hypothetical protein